MTDGYTVEKIISMEERLTNIEIAISTLQELLVSLIEESTQEPKPKESNETELD